MTGRTSVNEGQQNTLDHNDENIGKHPMAQLPPAPRRAGPRPSVTCGGKLHEHLLGKDAAQRRVTAVLHAPAKFR